MRKKDKIIVLLLSTLLLTSCAKVPDATEKDGIVVATDEYFVMAEQYPQQDIPEISIEEQNTEMLLACAGRYIEQIMEMAEGKVLVINGYVCVEKIKTVNRYKYVLAPPTEKLRESLFVAYFGERAAEAEYDERNEVWTVANSTAVGDYYLYSIFNPHAGATVSGEMGFQIEYRDVNLYPFEDNLLESVFDSGSKYSIEEAIALCDDIVKNIVEFSDFKADYVHAYGTEGRRPYYKIVYKRILDNMPVTGYNDFCFLVDDKGIEKIYGSIYEVEEIPLKEPVLSVEEAVNILQSNSTLISSKEEEILSVGKITMEYIVVNNISGEVYVTPVWRFWLGSNDDQMNIMRGWILAVDAVTGEIVYEERGNSF